jgi:hypothetical protein
VALSGVVGCLARWGSSEEEVVVGVEQWAEIRRLYFVKRLSIKEIVRRTGHGRNTILRALRSAEAPRYRRPPRPSKLDPFRVEIHRLLRSDPRLPGKRCASCWRSRAMTGARRRQSVALSPGGAAERLSAHRSRPQPVEIGPDRRDRAGHGGFRPHRRTATEAPTAAQQRGSVFDRP